MEGSFGSLHANAAVIGALLILLGVIAAAELTAGVLTLQTYGGDVAAFDPTSGQPLR